MVCLLGSLDPWIFECASYEFGCTKNRSFCLPWFTSLLLHSEPQSVPVALRLDFRRRTRSSLLFSAKTTRPVIKELNMMSSEHINQWAGRWVSTSCCRAIRLTPLLIRPIRDVKKRDKEEQAICNGQLAGKLESETEILVNSGGFT